MILVAIRRARKLSSDRACRFAWRASGEPDRRKSCDQSQVVKRACINVCCNSIIFQQLTAHPSLPIICRKEPNLKNNQTSYGHTEPGECVRPPLARFSCARVPSFGVRGVLTGKPANCVRGWRRGAEPFLSVEVSPLLDAGPEPRKYPKHRGLLREPVQGRRSIACARNAGPVQEMMRRKFTNSIQP